MDSLFPDQLSDVFSFPSNKSQSYALPSEYLRSFDENLLSVDIRVEWYYSRR